MLAKTPGEACRAWRIGGIKLLRPGAAYVLAIEYPEDAPRSMVVINTGNETARGFHTGTTLGDALHPKYVNNHNESLDVPLVRPLRDLVAAVPPARPVSRKGPAARRAGRGRLSPEDGFDVTIAQFSADNIPMSEGAAVAAIRLYEVVDPDQLGPADHPAARRLPRRHLFWREEMADGILADKSKNPTSMGVHEPPRLVPPQGRPDAVPRHQHLLQGPAGVRRLPALGSDRPRRQRLGAPQQPTPSDLWAEIVELMGEHGLDVLPYYEYSGSKGGKDSLGYQRRAKPLTRDDAYTHIKWIESANADLTDPATYDDFRKMLDLTVLRLPPRCATSPASGCDPGPSCR